jgi:hypothetical protein
MYVCALHLVESRRETACGAIGRWLARARKQPQPNESPSSWQTHGAQTKLITAVGCRAAAVVVVVPVNVNLRDVWAV